MPIWVACVARAHVDRGGGAVTVEKEALSKPLRAS